MATFVAEQLLLISKSPCNRRYSTFILGSAVIWDQPKVVRADDQMRHVLSASPKDAEAAHLCATSQEWTQQWDDGVSGHAGEKKTKAT